MSTYIRQLLRSRDLRVVMAIERAAFEFPWSKQDFARALEEPHVGAWVAEDACGVVGYLLFAVREAHYELLNLAVSSERRRRGIGAALVGLLQCKLSPRSRARRITLEVRETNLAAQQFFRACGFRATRVRRDFYDDTTEDAYHLVYRWRPAEPRSPIPSALQDDWPELVDATFTLPHQQDGRPEE